MGTRLKSPSSVDQVFELDISQVRKLIDKILEALANPRQHAEAENSKPVERSTQILEGLQALISAIHRRDTFVFYQPIVRDPLFTPTMRDLTIHLRDTYFAWLGARINSNKMLVLRSLLSHPVPDLLSVLGKTNEENTNSDMIRWLLDPRQAKVIAPAALCALVRTLDKTSEWQRMITTAVQQHTLSVRREYAISTEYPAEEALGRLDLLISGPSFKLIIENKVDSDEHDNQTVLYWNWLENEPEPWKGGIFLTPGGFPAQNTNFKPLSYIDLLSCLLEGPVKTGVDGIEQAVLASYIKALAGGILQRELHVMAP